MADAKISALPAVVTPATTDEFAVNQAATTKKMTLEQVRSSIPAASLTGSIADARVQESNVTQHEAAIDHDALTNFVADEHVAHSGVTITAGEGLTGGGTIAASRTIDMDVAGLADLLTPATVDYLLLYDLTDTTHKRANISSIVNLADHDALTNFNANEHVDHTGVTLTAGAGLTGGGTIAADRSFAVGAGTGITVNADDVQIADGGVDTTQLADSGVTNAKLANSAAYTLKGNYTAGAAAPTDTKISALTEELTPGSGDFVIIEESGGALRKADLANLPSSGITEVSDDTTPQLGGNLDVNGNEIVSASNGDITIQPNGTGDIQLLAGDVVVEEDILHAGDTDTKLTVTTDSWSIVTGGSSRADVNNSGLRLGAANSRVTTILDEDNMVSDSNTSLATQQSIKAYVDANIGSGDVSITGTPADNQVAVWTGAAAIEGTANLTYTTSGLTVANSVFVGEQASAQVDVAGDGQIWVKDDTPNILKFTDDAGTDHSLLAESDSTGITLVSATLAHRGDTDNTYAFTTDTQTISTGGSERVSVNNSGIQFGGAGARITQVLDEDNMASNSATGLATQQSIKAYADTKLGNVVEDTSPQLGAQLDINGFGLGDGTLELLTFSETGSAVNHLQVANAATGNAPTLSAVGDDTNVGIIILGKGTGNVTLGNYVLDGDQTVGATQDNYIFTYDDSSGLVTLEENSRVNHTGGDLIASTTKTASFSFALADAETKIVLADSASAITATVEPNSTVAFPVGAIIHVMRVGTGTVTLAPGAGVTITRPGGTDLDLTTDQPATLWQQATNTWYLYGGLITTGIYSGDEEILTFSATASAVNHLEIGNATAGNGPTLTSTGDDTHIDVVIQTKGDGNIVLNADDVHILADLIHDGDEDTKLTFATDSLSLVTGGSTRWNTNNSGVLFGGSGARITTVLDEDDMTTDSSTALATQQSIKAYVDANGGGLSNVVDDTTPQLGGQLDVNGFGIGDGTLELLTFTETASAVNHVNITNAVTASGPSIYSAGDDANIDLTIGGKGGGNLLIDADDVYIEEDILHSGDTDTKIIFTNNQLAFNTGGTARLTLNSSGLDVGSNSIISTVTDGDITIEPNGNGDIVLAAGDVNIENDLRHSGDIDTLMRFSTNEISFQAGGTEYLKMNSSGVDFSAEEVFGNRVDVVTTSGSLTTASHSGKYIITNGNITIPNASGDVGFNCTVRAGGAHTVTFNSTTSPAMASGDVMSIIVESTTAITAIQVDSGDKVSFT